MSSQVKYLTKQTPIDERLVYLLADRDKKAIELVFEHYGFLLFNVINKVLRDEKLSEDVLQAVLIKIWNNGDSYDPKKGSLYTWLVQISKNAAIDKTRSKDYLLTRKSKDALDLVSIAEEYVSDQIEELYLQQMVDTLPVEQKKLIDLSFFQGYTHKEISENLNMPLGTVKTRIRSAIQQLRSII